MQEIRGGTIALIGLMGAGKTKVGRILAQRLDVSFVDLDARIESESGASVSAFFALHGEAEFRALERRTLVRTVESAAGVLACGGGTVLDPANRELLRARCRAVWLEVSPCEAERRIAGDGATRPLASGPDPAARLTELLEARDALYSAVAVARVPTDGRTVEQVASDVAAALGIGES